MSKTVTKMFNKSNSSYNIMDFQMYKKKDFISRIKNSFKTKIALNSISSVFTGFKENELIQEAKKNYQNLYRAINTKDKGQLSFVVSYPLYEFYGHVISDKIMIPLPKKVELGEGKILSARVLKTDIDNVKVYNTWYQITIGYQIENSNKDIHDRVIVLERKESSTSSDNWRICHVE